MSREELSPIQSFLWTARMWKTREIIFFLCIAMTENNLRAEQIVETFSDLADSLLFGKTETLNETNIKNYSLP